MIEMKIFKITTILIITIFIGLLSGDLVFASETDGTIDSTYKYAWGENIGWINFGTSNGNVHVTDSGLSGYAFGENVGWINLDNVTNDGEGNLSGYAWGENIGWINFNPTYGGVTINSSGEFSGYAWGENIGWIVFNCATTNSCTTVDYKVKTDWRPQSTRPACNNTIDDDNDGKIDYPNDPGCSSLDDNDETDPGSGGLPPDAYNPPTPPAGGFSILINDGDKYTENREVTLKLIAGSDTARIAISNDPGFSGPGTGQISFQSPYTWDLCYWQKQCPEGTYTVYVKFYTRWGRSSNTISDSIVYKKGVAAPEKPKGEKPILYEDIPAGFSFERNLSYGDKNEDVKYLQIILKEEIGPPTYPEHVPATGRFGLITRNSVIAFQEKYTSDILAPWGLTKGTGYVGKATRKKINEILGR